MRNQRNHQLPAATRLLNWPKLYAEQQLEILSGCQTTFRIRKVDAGSESATFYATTLVPAIAGMSHRHHCHHITGLTEKSRHLLG